MLQPPNRLVKWVLGRLITPVDPVVKKVSEYNNDWDYAHTNDQAIIDAEVYWDRVSEALTLRDSDPERAFDLLLRLAEQGSVYSMLAVAWRYRNGGGVTPDVAKAEYWYRRAYNGGSETALLGYAILLERRGAHELCEKAYRAGADRGWAPASYRLAEFLLKRRKGRETIREALALLERAAQQECPGAQYILAHLMARGRFGVWNIRRGMRLMRAYWRRLDADADHG